MLRNYDIFFSYVVGVIRRDRLTPFERILWRASHHTAYLRAADVAEPFEAENVLVFQLSQRGLI